MQFKNSISKSAEYNTFLCIQICKLEPKVRNKKGNFEFDDCHFSKLQSKITNGSMTS